MRELVIDGTRITDDGDCYVIAEIGHNHQGIVEQAKELITRRRECGVDAVKLQKRDNRSLYTRAIVRAAVRQRESASARRTASIARRSSSTRDAYLELQRHAREPASTFFATAFDVASADFLAELDMPAYKIASGDLRNTPLLRHVAAIGKPMIVSTGGATLDDVDRAVDDDHGRSTRSSASCSAPPPTRRPPRSSNLSVITTLRERFPELVIGLSDHQNGIAMALVAYMLGARVIEKHFTLNHALEGHRPRVLAHARGHAQARPRPAARARRARRRRQAAARRSRSRRSGRWARSSSPRASSSRATCWPRATSSRKSPADGGLPPYELDGLVGRALRRRAARGRGDHARRPRAGSRSRSRAQRGSSRDRARDAARAVRLAVFDFDGVFTDNRVWVNERRRARRVALLRARRARPAPPRRGRRATRSIVSMETNPIVERARARSSASTACRGSRTSCRCFARSRQRRGDRRSRTRAYVGNDINDAECLGAVGLPVVPADAWPEVKPLAQLGADTRRAATAACASSATLSGRRASERRRDRRSLRPRRPRRRRHRRRRPARGRSTRRPRRPWHARWRSSTSQQSPAATATSGATRVDVTDRASIEAATAEVVAEWGVPHVLVNNAALDSPPDAPPEEVGPVRDLSGGVVRRGDGREREGDVPLLPGDRRAHGRAGPRLDRQRLVDLRHALAAAGALRVPARGSGETFFKPVAYSVSKSALST